MGRLGQAPGGRAQPVRAVCESNLGPYILSCLPWINPVGHFLSKWQKHDNFFVLVIL